MKLFEPLTIRGMTLRNRIVMVAMNLGLGLRGRRARGYYVERARGGAGAIITGTTSVDCFCDPQAWGGEEGLSAFLEGLRPLIQEVQAQGAKFGMQLWHGNRFPAGRDIERAAGGELTAPSPRVELSRPRHPATHPGEEMRELARQEIKTIIDRFGQAAARCREAGFNFVQAHGAHGYLLSQFFSGADNRRSDEYGGSPEGRMRMGLEVMAAMRRAVGQDYPLSYRLASWEDRPGGIQVEEAAAFARELERAGVDFLDISVGLGAGVRSYSSPTKKHPMGTLVPLAHEVKKAVGVPVIGVGRINNPAVAERFLAEGKVDLIGIGRQLIADPFWPQKAQEGRANQIVPCDSCNKECMNNLRTGGTAGCHLNPRVGREWEMPLS